jgi:hypothetical protein
MTRLVCLTLFVAGCWGSLDPAQFGVASACGDVPTTVFSARCASSSCHAAAWPAAGLDLQSPSPGTRLMNKPATGGAGLIIDAAHPNRSVLYLKLTPTPPFGNRMPLGGMLDGSTIDCVGSWIAQQVGVDGGT